MMNGILSRDHSWTTLCTRHITTLTIRQPIYMVIGGKIREAIGLYIESDRDSCSCHPSGLLCHSYLDLVKL